MEVLDKPKSLVTAYQPFYAQLAEFEKASNSLLFDYQSPKGNKEARSHINSLRLIKGSLERARKSAKEESLLIGRAVDYEAKQIEARIELMICIHQGEIDKIEQREKDRIDVIQIKIDALNKIHWDKSAQDYKFHIATLEAVVIDDQWSEFALAAARAKDSSLTEHRRLLQLRARQDADDAELARLRTEFVARERKDHDEVVAKAATERANAEAANAAKQQREASERRELELKLAAETSERRRVEAEQKAVNDAKQAAEFAEREKTRAVLYEQKRVAALAEAEAIVTAKREANTAHKARVNNAVLAALIDGGLTDNNARMCVILIASGKIPAVQINY